MDGKRDEAKRSAAAAAVSRAEFADQLMALLLASATDPAALEKTARTIGTAAKSVLTVLELQAYTPSGADDDAMDFAEEDRLRAGVLSQLAAVAARLEQDGVAPCPGCGRFDLDPERLEQLVRARSEPASR